MTSALVRGPIWRGALLAAALHLCLVLPGLDQPGTYVFDEVYQAYTAGRYVAGDAAAYRWDTRPVSAPRLCAYEWIHPPVAKLILAASIGALGDGPWGWRLPPALCGAALVALAYAFARRLRMRDGAAELAALALATDGMVLVMSRTGMADVFVALAILAAFGLFARWYDARGSVPAGHGRPQGPILWGLGLVLGLGIATKWFALLAWGWIGLVVGGDALVRLARGLRQGAGLRAAWPLGRVLLALVALPAAIYVAAHAAFFAHGNGWSDFTGLLRQQWYYHLNLQAQHAYASAWWGWPLQLRSVWLWTGTAGAVHRDIYLVGNPILWWGAVVALPFVARDVVAAVWSRRAPATGKLVVVMAFLGLWLPWALPARTAFLYYILSAAPFAALAFGWGATSLGAWLAQRWRFADAAVLVVAALALVGMFGWLYPIWTGAPLDEAGLAARLLLPGWR